MKKLLLILMSIVGTVAACAVEIKCTGCNAKVLPGDKFCPNCGARFEEPSPVEPPQTPELAPQYQPPSPKPKAEQSEHWNEVENHKPGHALPVPMGMLRGLAEIACVPLEFFREASQVTCSAWKTFSPPGAIFMSVVVMPPVVSFAGCLNGYADVLLGAGDIVSLGTIGNAFWDTNGKSPYVFQRNWTDSIGHGTCGPMW